MSLARKLSIVLAIALIIALGTGCCTFDPKTTADGVKVKTHEFNSIEFVWIPPGTFQMGSPEDEPGRDIDESPVHTVTFEKGFWITRREISQEEYALVMKDNPSPEKAEEMPVTNVSWLDAMAFCEKLSAESGANYCLPTEAQWEYAARAGTSSTYHFGEDPVLLEVYDWYAVNTPGKDVQYPAQKAPNRWGLYDVHGNLSEWCYDIYAEDYYARSCATGPTGPEEGAARVVRGGSIKADAAECRVANRAHAAPEAKSPTTGFRVVRETLPTRVKYYPPVKENK
ncbi:MAG: formylglycine-generating enzyme family protein [Candidatus Hydrogenedentota bacterium]